MWIYQGNDKNFFFFRRDINGEIIETHPVNIWFTVRESKETNAKVLFQKKLYDGIEKRDDHAWIIQIKSTDTQDIKPGRYFCDVMVNDENGHYLTIVEPQSFDIRDVATRAKDRGGY